MFKAPIKVILIIFLLSAISAHSLRAQQIQPIEDSLYYELLTLALLDQNPDPSCSYLDIYKYTQTITEGKEPYDCYFLDPIKITDPIIKPLLIPLQKANAESWLLTHIFPFFRKVNLVNEEEIELLYKDYYKSEKKTLTYPNEEGLYFLSNIAYNSSRNQAILYIENYKGPLSAVAWVYCFSLDKGTWQITWKLMCWVS